MYITIPTIPSTLTDVRLLPELGNTEWLYAQHQTQFFPRHSHERYALGVVERGALAFHYRGENVVAAAGDINLCIPGEVHTGQPATTLGWTYRMFYFDTAFLTWLTADITGFAYGLPFFKSGTIRDPSVAEQLRALHASLAAGAGRLERDTALLSVLTELVQRHADTNFSLRPVHQEAKAVQEVRAYLETHYADDISLEALSQLTGLSRYHLVRVFKKTVGVPPHAYLRQVRVRRAKALLSRGEAVAQAAAATGFADQSHLSRWFKRFWGFTPGHYRNSVQDNLT